MFIRAIGLIKEVYDWFSFSQQVFSWLGLAQRAATDGNVYGWALP
jgi:hypothetical protein